MDFKSVFLTAGLFLGYAPQATSQQPQAQSAAVLKTPTLAGNIDELASRVDFIGLRDVHNTAITHKTLANRDVMRALTKNGFKDIDLEFLTPDVEVIIKNYTDGKINEKAMRIYIDAMNMSPDPLRYQDAIFAEMADIAVTAKEFGASMHSINHMEGQMTPQEFAAESELQRKLGQYISDGIAVNPGFDSLSEEDAKKFIESKGREFGAKNPDLVKTGIAAEESAAARNEKSQKEFFNSEVQSMKTPQGMKEMSDAVKIARENLRTKTKQLSPEMFDIMEKRAADQQKLPPKPYAPGERPPSSSDSFPGLNVDDPWTELAFEVKLTEEFMNARAAGRLALDGQLAQRIMADAKTPDGKTRKTVIVYGALHFMDESIQQTIGKDRITTLAIASSASGFHPVTDAPKLKGVPLTNEADYKINLGTGEWNSPAGTQKIQVPKELRDFKDTQPKSKGPGFPGLDNKWY